MEKALSVDERIRRAEELYYGKMNKDARKVQTNNKKEKKSKGNVLLKFLIILITGTSIYAYQNCTYVFSEQFLNDINNFNIKQNIENAFKYVRENFLIETVNITNEISETNKIEQNISKMLENSVSINEENITDNEKNIFDAENVIDLEKIKENELQEQKEKNTENIENIEEKQKNNIEEKNNQLSEMELDAKFVKENYSLIIPLKGTITSEYGHRTSEYENVTSYHTGIDISGTIGKEIVSAMDGIVTLVSEKGSYGNHIKIESEDVLTLYAHCSKIFVSKGEKIKQGQKIAEVGNTGNTTGPHLHFEIRRQNRYIDPRYILDF